MKKIFSILFALALVLSFSVVFTTPVAAATYTVDDNWQVGVPPYAEDTDADNDFATIQAAVDASSSGDTINVAAGTYVETVTLQHHSLNIIGAGKDLVTWDGNAGKCIDWHEPPATPVITSCRFEISGFTFQSYMPSVNGGMIKICKVNRYQNIGFGLDFHDNRLITSGDSNYGLWLCRNSGIARNASGDSAVRIHDNIFETTSGICMSNSDNYDIYNNDFTYDVVGNGFATRKNAAIYIGSGCTTEQPSRGGHHIWGNDFAHVGDGYDGTEATYPRGAICIDHYSGQTGLTLLANTIECNTFNNPNGSGIHYYLGDNVAYPTAIVKQNSFSGNLWGIFIDGSYADNLKVLAENNWWGDYDGSGPYDPQDENLGGVAEINEVPPCPTTDGIRKMMNTNGNGDEVCGRVDYCPWLDYHAGTTTGAGNASFTVSPGCISNLAAVSPTPSGCPVALPYGVFSFNISCIDPGEQVTVTVTLPGPVPKGSRWYKYQNGSWYSLPIGSDDGDNIITVTLQDGVFPGDEDSISGHITDDGGPGGGGAAVVGWETHPTNKVRVLLPWIALLAAIVAGASLFLIKRRRAQG
jgi:hypothetical protein